MINKEFIIEEVCREIYDDACYYGDDPSLIRDIDEVHDIALGVHINGIPIEEYDAIYWKMCSILQADGDEIIGCINDFIDEECQSYYGDPAFSSANDYWGYILG